MIEVEKLKKTYGDFVALNDVSFTVGKGQVVGFLGPNGAGKSTTLRILCGYLGMTSGAVRIDGIDVRERPIEARGRTGYMPETAPLYTEMRVSEYLTFRAELKRVPSRERKRAVEKAIADTSLGDVEGTVIEQLSKGFRQRVALADALVASPPLLVLDEPTAGLDPNQIREVRALVKELGKERTVLFSTHILSEVEAICSHAVLIARGSLIAAGSLSELRDKAGVGVVRVGARATVDAIRGALVDLPGVEVRPARLDPSRAEAPDPEVTTVDLTFGDAGSAGSLVEKAVFALAAAKIPVREVRPAASLEQVFADLTAAPAVAKSATAETAANKPKKKKR